jgi:hypothetical protein
MAWNTILNNNSDLNHTNRIQALSLISDCYKHLMDLSTNAGIVSEAMMFVSSKTKQLNTLHKQDDYNKIEPMQEANTNTKTTNRVF